MASTAGSCIKCGPKPSLAVVEAEALTQFCLNKEFPTKNNKSVFVGKPGTA